MPKILSSLLIIAILVFSLGIYCVDKAYFLCPILYKNGMIIRSDSRGDGLFAAKRSGSRLHDGIDLLADIGTPVAASRCGIVVSATRNKGMGSYVIIRHPGNLVTIYGHLSEICVTKNKFIRQGEVIGKVGKTGNANYRDIQPHLHFEVRNNGSPQDPLEYLE
jgi:murein DD-endopeptidase MepM/ murein hydrolase activator NlpD